MVLGLIPEKVEVENKKLVNTRKDNEFRPLRFPKRIQFWLHLFATYVFPSRCADPNCRRRPGNVLNTKSLELGLVGGILKRCCLVQFLRHRYYRLRSARQSRECLS